MQELTATPAQKMLLVMNIIEKPMYQGTASPTKTAERRSKNKMARQSRKANR